ncbi:MAG: carboxylating nicotinate-nucleotide diphosphorylase, partial [Bacteroidota bacterium]
MLKPSYLTEENVHTFIQRALKEDIGEGDHSTLASVPAQARRKAQLIIKGEGILAGVELAELIFKTVDPELRLDLRKKDGEKVRPGEIGFFVEGKARSILTAERLVLNCLQRMSGIATLTHKAVELIAHTSAKLLDTRKTTPNFRMAEKWAVYIGGGHNHRYGLFDMIMLKDNHISYAGGIREAIEGTLRYQQLRNSSLK